MNALPGRSAPASRDAWLDAAIASATATLPPGWSVLSGCVLRADGGDPPARLRCTLLHPRAGIALLDVLPDPRAPRAVERVRRMLEDAGFTVAFGGLPPVIHLCIPSHTRQDLGRLLDEQFAADVTHAPPSRETWVRVAEAVLAGRPAAPAHASARWTHARGWPGVRSLATLWGAVLVLLSGGILVLNHLGPPDPSAGRERHGTESSGSRVNTGGAWIEPAAFEESRLPPLGRTPAIAAEVVGDGNGSAFPARTEPVPFPPTLVPELPKLPPLEEFVVLGTFGLGRLIETAPMPAPVMVRSATGASAGEPDTAGAVALPPERSGAPGQAAAESGPRELPATIQAAAEPLRQLDQTARRPEPTADVTALQSPQPPSSRRAPAASAAAAAPSLPLPVQDALVRRGDEMLRRGDISAAQRLYERAAQAGSAEAMTALGRTHDAGFLARIGALGMRGDPAAADAWYRRAAALGNKEARDRLAASGAAGE